MIHVFYFFGILYLLQQIMRLLNPKGLTNTLIQFERITKEIKARHDSGNESKEAPKGFGGYLFFVITSICTILWAMLGLMTFNWLVFLTYLVLMLFVFSPILKRVKRIHGLGFMYTSVQTMKAMINVVLIGFAIINHYHLRIDLLSLITQ